MKVYLTGDTFGDVYFDRLYKFTSNHKELTKDDYIIVLGNCLGISDDKTYQDLIKMYSSLNCTVLFIDGDNENYKFINNLEVGEFKGGKCHYLSDSLIHLMRGEIYDFSNFKVLSFGGAESLLKEEMIKNDEIWYKEQVPTLKELKNGLDNLSKHNNKVDYIITHEAPSSSFLYEVEKLSFTTKLLDKIDNVARCKMWYFAHYQHDLEVRSNKKILFKKFERII